jgi:hypothetical protein
MLSLIKMEIQMCSRLLRVSLALILAGAASAALAEGGGGIGRAGRNSDRIHRHTKTCSSYGRKSTSRLTVQWPLMHRQMWAARSTLSHNQAWQRQRRRFTAITEQRDVVLARERCTTKPHLPFFERFWSCDSWSAFSTWRR